MEMINKANMVLGLDFFEEIDAFKKECKTNKSCNNEDSSKHNDQFRVL